MILCVRVEKASSDEFNATLDAVKGTTDGIMDDVHDKRKIYGADMVVMMIDGGSLCGVASMVDPPDMIWCSQLLVVFALQDTTHLGTRLDITWCVSVLLKDTMQSTQCSFVAICRHHCTEIGSYQYLFLQGCNHDKGSTNACSDGAYNYGWHDPNAQFHDIMSYDCESDQCDGNPGGSCSRIQRFSNSTYLWEGMAVGSTAHNCARQINEVKGTIAMFEAEKTISHWNCYRDSTLVDQVDIWWGHVETDAVWTCNEWIPECEDICRVSSS